MDVTKWETIKRWFDLILYCILAVLFFEMFSKDITSLWLFLIKRVQQIPYLLSLFLPILLEWSSKNRHIFKRLFLNAYLRRFASVICNQDTNAPGNSYKTCECI